MKNIMNKSNIKGSNDRRDVNSEWFTGKTWMKVLSEKIKSKDQDIYHVHFEKGSRTKLPVSYTHLTLPTKRIV